MEFLKKLWSNEDGQGMVEYALIIALVALVVALIIPGVTQAIANLFKDIADALKAPTTAPTPTT